MARPSKKLGRPPLRAEDRRSRILKFRSRGNMQEQLQRAADVSGRSLSEEIERRVGVSLEQDHIAAMFGGPELMRLAGLAVDAFRAVGQFHAPGKKTAEWMADEGLFRRGLFAAFGALVGQIPGITEEQIAEEFFLLGRDKVSDIATRRLREHEQPKEETK